MTIVEIAGRLVSCQQGATGLQMGSPLSPLMAEIFMDNLETTLLKRNIFFKNKVLFWHRYVDDVAVLFQGSIDELHTFLNCLNTLHPKIQFTMETQNPISKSLPFLDLNIKIVGDKFEFSVYRKETCSPHVIPYKSSHSKSNKLAAFHSYFHRLLSLPLNKENFNNELNIIFHLAKINGFPHKLISNIFNKKRFKYFLDTQTSLKPDINSDKKFFSIPYIGPSTTKIANTLKTYNIQISSTISNSLRHTLSHLKDPIPLSDRSGVYKLTCQCFKTYIGMTQRKMHIRVSEHFDEINKYKDKFDNQSIRSKFAEHALTTNHLVNKDTAEMLIMSDKKYICELLEKMYITFSYSKEPAKILNEQTTFDDIPLFSKFIKNNPSFSIST